MNWSVFCYWYEPDAPRDPVGLVRIWTLASQLSRSGDHITVFPPSYRSARIARGFPVVPIPLLHWPLIRPCSYVLGSFLAGVVAGLWRKPDVVYYRWMASPHPILIARLFGSLCLCEVNGEPVSDWESQAGRWKVAMKHWLARFSLRRCDRVIVLTQGLMDLLVSRYGVPAERIAILPSGTDTTLFTPRDRVRCRQEVGLESGAEYVGFVGSFYRYQGLACLLDAYALLSQQRPSLRLLLVGDGEAADSLRAQAERLGLSQFIVWTGRVPYERVSVLIGAMDICVAPFTANRGETSPVKLFDYLACGRPVVASAIPSVSSMFPDGSGVIFVPPGVPAVLATALLRLLQQPEHAAELGRQGRRVVEERFSWDSLTRQLRRCVQRETTAAYHAPSHLL